MLAYVNPLLRPAEHPTLWTSPIQPPIATTATHTRTTSDCPPLPSTTPAASQAAGCGAAPDVAAVLQSVAGSLRQLVVQQCAVQASGLGRRQRCKNTLSGMGVAMTGRALCWTLTPRAPLRPCPRRGLLFGRASGCSLPSAPHPHPGQSPPRQLPLPAGAAVRAPCHAARAAPPHQPPPAAAPRGEPVAGLPAGRVCHSTDRPARPCTGLG